MSFDKYSNMVDETTNNKQFKNFLDAHHRKGCERFPLLIKDEMIKGLNPYDKNLTKGQKEWIIQECINNPIYFIREVVKDSKGRHFRLNIAVEYALFLYMNGASFIFNIPNYDQRTDLCSALFLHSLFSTGTKTIIGDMGMSNINKIKYNIPNYILDYIVTVENKVMMLNNDEFDNCSKPGFYLLENTSNFKLIDKNGKSELKNYLSNLNSYVRLSKPVFNTNMQCIIVGSHIPELYDEKVIGVKSIIKINKDIEMFRLDSNVDCIRKDCFYIIDMDMIEAEINMVSTFENIVLYYLSLNGEYATLLDLIKFFTKEALRKDYDSLDILDKIHCNRIFSDIHKQCDENIKIMITEINSSL